LDQIIMEVILAIAISTACWYWSSSINAISTQILFQLCKSETFGTQGSDVSVSIIPLAQLMTTCQLLMGGVMSIPIVFGVGSIFRRPENGDRKDGATSATSLLGESIKKEDLIIGFIHYFGSLCTNMGFGYGSASLVQCIKLLEPIETLILSVIAILVRDIMRGGGSSLDQFGQNSFNGTHEDIRKILSPRKIGSTLTIILGTSMLLAQKSMETNPKSIIFAIGSGVCMSLRNVLKSTSGGRSEDKPTKSMPSMSFHQTFRGIFSMGMENFARMTILAAVPSVLITCGFIASNNLPLGSITSFLASNPNATTSFVTAVIFHCFYNIFSITVLSMTSAPVHSLLNVGKRIANVLAAAIKFSVPLTVSGQIGIFLAGIGAFMYKEKSMKTLNKTGILKANNRGVRRFFLWVFFSMTFHFAIKSQSFVGDYNQSIQMKKNDLKHLVPTLISFHELRNSTTKFVVWMYPFPPPSPSAQSLQHILKLRDGELLICPYSSACQGHGVAINLVELTEGTFYQSYVLDHPYYKLRHFHDFSHHIQAITMITLLSRGRKGACVRTLGGSSTFCDSEVYLNYNPYHDERDVIMDLRSTEFPFEFFYPVGSISDHRGLTTLDSSKPFQSLPLAPDMTTEQFSTYGPYYTEHVKGYNSGEDIQSLAGAGWLPFVSGLRDKSDPLKNYTGYYINNCLNSGDGAIFRHFTNGTERLYMMDKTELVSIFASKQYISDNYVSLEEYTSNVYAFGCRSQYTDQWMKDNRIKSYFSACLTLTSMYQGGTLSLNGTNPSHNAMTIREPQRNTTDRIVLAHEKDLILIVDAVDTSVIPQEVKDKARFLYADIPAAYPYDARSWDEKMRYCYRLISQYKNYAKVVITSRIHVGLPAAALGTPVIFISKNGWLPGGHERTGRVAGLLDVFHRVDEVRGLPWTFGNLEDPVPPNPGNHYADRFRASFWNRLKRNEYYADAAKLFGRIPLQRLGAGMHRSEIQNKFHFIMQPSDLLHWQQRRAVESILFHHPNAKVYVHVDIDLGPLDWGDFGVFMESGYDVQVLRLNRNELIKEARHIVRGRIHENDSTLLAGMLVYKHGGVFLAKNIYAIRELSAFLNAGYTKDTVGNITMMVGEQSSVEVLKYFSTDDKEPRSAPRPSSSIAWEVKVLSKSESRSCQVDLAWDLELTDFVAVSIDPQSLVENDIFYESRCYDIIEKHCIYCDDLHWEYVPL